MKRLIVTADDLGLHPGMTDGAIHAHRQGIVTACSVSACGRDLDRTAAKLLEEPGLDVGIHFTLVEERPVLPSEQIPSLVRHDGRFPRKWPQFLGKYLTGRLDRGEIEAELRAQLATLRDRGLTIIHANSHQHLHLLPGLRATIRQIAEDSGIEYVRTVRDRALSRWSPRALLIRVLATIGRAGSAISNDATIGVTDAGHLEEGEILMLLGRVRGVTELVAHPGLGDADIAAAYDWGYAWERETEALTSPRLREALERSGIELIRIRDLVRDSR